FFLAACWATSCPPGGGRCAGHCRAAALLPDRREAPAARSGSRKDRILMVSASDAPGPAPGARNVTLEDLAALLKDQRAPQVDVVAPASTIRASRGQLVIEGTDPVIDGDGVTLSAGTANKRCRAASPGACATQSSSAQARSSG